jgi:hypothetical protein
MSHKYLRLSSFEARLRLAPQDDASSLFLILGSALLRASKDDLVISYGPSRHCEERSDEAIHYSRMS